MSVKLTESEAKLIVESRGNPKIQLWANYLVLAAVLIGYFAARDGALAWDTFASGVVAVAVSSLLHMQFKVYPVYHNLHSLIEQKVSESSDAIQTINAVKNGT